MAGSTWAQRFAATMFALLATAAARGFDNYGKIHTGGARYVTKKRHRHGRTYRQGHVTTPMRRPRAIMVP